MAKLRKRMTMSTPRFPYPLLFEYPPKKSPGLFIIYENEIYPTPPHLPIPQPPCALEKTHDELLAKFHLGTNYKIKSGEGKTWVIHMMK